LKSFSPLYLHDLNTQARRVIFGVSKTLCDFGHKNSFKEYTHTHTHLTALFRHYPGEPVPERQNQSEARDSEWQWHQLGHMQVCTSLQTDNHASTPPLKCGSKKEYKKTELN